MRQKIFLEALLEKNIVSTAIPPKGEEWLPRSNCTKTREMLRTACGRIFC
jgi:hypothetical protein